MLKLHKKQETNSLLESLKSSRANKKELLDSLSKEEIELLNNEWIFTARKNQLAPTGDWQVWLIMAGRGFGKSRAGCEWVIEQVRHNNKKRFALVGRSAADVRDVIVEGESGILACSPRDFKPEYFPSKRRLVWPNGAVATCFSSQKPDQLRGPQFDAAYADEVASWEYSDTWNQLMFGLRLGYKPQVVATTTPRPRRFLREIAKQSTTVVTRGATKDNIANLPDTFIKSIYDQYQYTTQGRQELDGELLDQAIGAVWSRDSIERNRLETHGDLERVVVAIDPAITSNEETSDESGIIVAGIDADGHFFVLEDMSCIEPPDAVIGKGIALFHKFQADKLVVEKNQGGDVWRTISNHIDPTVPVSLVHASKGKSTRAEPVAARYEQNLVSHVGIFSELEDQLCNFVPMQSAHDDRLDALVWAITELDFYRLPHVEFDDNKNVEIDLNLQGIFGGM